MKIMKILKSNLKIMKIMKVQECHASITKNQANLKFPIEIVENSAQLSPIWLRVIKRNFLTTIASAIAISNFANTAL